MQLPNARAHPNSSKRGQHATPCSSSDSHLPGRVGTWGHIPPATGCGPGAAVALPGAPPSPLCQVPGFGHASPLISLARLRWSLTLCLRGASDLRCRPLLPSPAQWGGSRAPSGHSTQPRKGFLPCHRRNAHELPVLYFCCQGRRDPPAPQGCSCERPPASEPSPQTQPPLPAASPCPPQKKNQPRQTPTARHGTIDLFISIIYSSSTFP